VIDLLAKEKIRTFYERMTFELRSLERFKKKHGICIGGISCMEKAAEGARACPMHLRRNKMRAEGKDLEPLPKFSTEYGRMRKQEIEGEREERRREEEAKAKNKTSRKAARRAA
jgi:hypothetical protein